MPNVIKQTSRQVKAAYRKNDGRPSEREIRRLENLAAADRRAEELRAKEKQRVANRKKREEKAKKDREARLAIGIGDATQRAGFNFTQRRQKDWFRGYFAKAKQPGAADISGARLHPPAYDSGNEHDGTDHSNDDSLTGDDTTDQSDHLCDAGDDGESPNDADDSATEKAAHAVQDDSANETDPWETDECGDDEVPETIQALIRDRLASCYIPNSASGLKADGNILDADAPILNAEEATVNISEPNTNAADERNLAEQDEQDDLFDDADLDDDTMLELAQFELPTAEALLPISTAKPKTQVAQEIGTPDRQPHAMSDFFPSSELDISAEDLAEMDAPPKQSPLCQAKSVPRAPSTPTRTVAPRQRWPHGFPTPLATTKSPSLARTTSGASLMPPPPKPTLKRKFNDSDSHATRIPPSPKHHRPTTMTTTPQPPRPVTPPARQPARRAPIPHNFSFANIGMSTQLIEDNLSDDEDALLSSPVLVRPAPSTTTTATRVPPPPPPPQGSVTPRLNSRRVSTAAVPPRQRPSHFEDIGLSTQLVCEAAWEDVVLSSP